MAPFKKKYLTNPDSQTVNCGKACVRRSFWMFMVMYGFRSMQKSYTILHHHPRILFRSTCFEPAGWTICKQVKGSGSSSAFYRVTSLFVPALRKMNQIFKHLESPTICLECHSHLQVAVPVPKQSNTPMNM